MCVVALLLLHHCGHCRPYIGSGAQIGRVSHDQRVQVVVEVLISGFQPRLCGVYELLNHLSIVVELA